MNVVGAQVNGSRPTTDYLGDVVVAAQPANGIEVEALAGRVRGDAGWEAHVQAPPCLAGMLPAGALDHLNVFASQQVRNRKVIPHRVAGEVDRIQRIPTQVAAQARAAEECGPWVGARAKDLAVSTFDPCCPCVEDPLLTASRERIEDCAGFAYLHGEVVVGEAISRNPGSE